MVETRLLAIVEGEEAAMLLAVAESSDRDEEAAPTVEGMDPSDRNVDESNGVERIG